MSRIKEYGRCAGIGSLAVIGAWYIGANNYLGIKDGYEWEHAAGTLVGATFEAGAGSWYVGGRVKRRITEKMEEAIDRNRSLIAASEAVLSNNYIELQDGKAIAFPIRPTEEDRQEQGPMKESQVYQMIFLDQPESHR